MTKILMSDEEFLVWSEETMNIVRDLSPCICLVELKDNIALHGLVENSFSLGVHDRYVNLQWPYKERTSYETAEDMINQYKNIEFKKTYIYNIFDENLPVLLDWDKWLKDTRPANTLSGVSSKYGHRNILFTTPGQRTLVNPPSRIKGR